MIAESLALHDHTKKQIKQFIARPSHAVLIAGPTGIGKQSIAYSMAQKVLNISVPIDQYPYALFVKPQKDKQTIGIEEVRKVEHFLSLKVPRAGSFTRVVIIANSQLLGHEAQNAMLKTLEEPPAGTLIILTSDSPQSLLPTIQSRVQVIALQSPTYNQLHDHFIHLDKDPEAIKRAYSMSGGLPGLMHAIMSDTDHPLLRAAVEARSLLGQSSYERLTQIDRLVKDKQLTHDMLFILQQMAHVSLQSAQGSVATQWQHVLSAAYEANEAIATSAQPKLALTKLMLSL